MLNKLFDQQFLNWLSRNTKGLLVVLLGLSLAANYYLWAKYTEVVERSIEFERERVKNFDDIVKKLIDNQKTDENAK